MTLLLVAGQLWRQIPSTGGWWTLKECVPDLYRYAYSEDPTQAPAGDDPGKDTNEAMKETPC